MPGQLWPLPATVLLAMLLPDYAAVRCASATRPSAMAVISTYASRGSVAIPAGGFGGALQTVADRIGMYVELLGRGLERTAELQECGDGEQRRIIRACCCQASVDHADQFVTGVRVADQRTFGQGVVGA